MIFINSALSGNSWRNPSASSSASSVPTLALAMPRSTLFRIDRIMSGDPSTSLYQRSVTPWNGSPIVWESLNESRTRSRIGRYRKQ